MDPCGCCVQAFSDVFPHLVTATHCPKLVKIDDVDYGQVDAIFCCLPHATTQVRHDCRERVQRQSQQSSCETQLALALNCSPTPTFALPTQEVIKKLPTHLKIVDLSADFRLKDPLSYAEW